MKNYSIMLKPASSLCDLRCRYCFYADVAARRSVRSFGMMQDSVLRRIMENIARSVAPGDHITLMFQGGEPKLAGLDFFRTLTEIADSWPSGISARPISPSPIWKRPFRSAARASARRS